MSPDAASLPEQVQQFAEDLSALLRGVFVEVPNVVVSDVEPRFLVRPEGQEESSGGVPLLIDGEHLATLRVRYLCQLDSRATWLAVAASREWVVAEVDRTPLIRFDYRRDPHSDPSSHIQVHAHRGALSHLMSRARRANPHDISYVRIPTGGPRLRPCLADILQMLITQIGVDAREGWDAAVTESRRRFREVQVRALVRDQPELAADVLETLDYRITRPVVGPPGAGTKSLTTW